MPLRGSHESRRAIVVRASVELPAPRRAVWDFLHSAGSALELSEDVIEAETLPGPVGLGERQRFLRRHGDHTHASVIEVVAYDEPNFVAIESVDRPLPFRCEMTVEDAEDGTRVTHVHTTRLKLEHRWRLRQARFSRERLQTDALRGLERELDDVRSYFLKRGRGQ